MTITQPRLLVSIINWNGVERTLSCIEQLQQQDYPNYTLIVVDNASQPDVRQQLRDQLPDDVRLIESPENRGYAGGHQLALAIAQSEKYDCFCLLNTDVILQSNMLSLFVEAYQQQGIALYGTVPLQQADDVPLAAHPVLFHRKYFQQPYREILFDSNTVRQLGDLFPTMQAREVAALAGSCLFMPLSLVEQYGFMDTDYFMYSEEVDYCFRLRQDSVACIAVPQAYLMHESGGASKQYNRLHSIINYYRLRNQLVRINRYGSRFDVFRAVMKNIALIVSYPIVQGRVGIEKSTYAIRATLDGLRGKLGKTYAPEDYINS